MSPRRWPCLCLLRPGVYSEKPAGPACGAPGGAVAPGGWVQPGPQCRLPAPGKGWGGDGRSCWQLSGRRLPLLPSLGSGGRCQKAVSRAGSCRRWPRKLSEAPQCGTGVGFARSATSVHSSALNARPPRSHAHYLATPPSCWCPSQNPGWTEWHLQPSLGLPCFLSQATHEA